MPLRPDLLRWQWDGYSRFHTQRANLLLHIVAVPTFIGATVGLIGSIASLDAISAATCAGTMVIAFVVQGLGHKREPEPPIAFDGIADVISRIFVEQFVTFPRFVLSGGWGHALRKSSDG